MSTLLPEQEAGIAAVKRLRNELEKESDRAAVLIAAAMLEEALEHLLKVYLVPMPSGVDTLFDGPTSPFGAFSGKIEGAYRTGRISPLFTRDLHIVRRIRNDFAHRASSFSFEDNSVKSRIEELTKSHGIFTRSPKFLEAKGMPSLRLQFIEATAWMLYYLQAESKRVSSLLPGEPEFGYTFSFDSE